MQKTQTHQTNCQVIQHSAVCIFAKHINIASNLLLLLFVQATVTVSHLHVYCIKFSLMQTQVNISYVFCRFLSAGLPQRVLIDIGEKVLQDYKALRESQPNMLCHGDTRMHNIVINEKTGIFFCISLSLPRLPNLSSQYCSNGPAHLSVWTAVKKYCHYYTSHTFLILQDKMR